MTNNHRLIVHLATTNFSFLALLGLYRALGCGPFNDKIGGIVWLCLNLTIGYRLAARHGMPRMLGHFIANHRWLKLWLTANGIYLFVTMIYILAFAWWWLPLSLTAWRATWLIINLPFLLKVIYNFISRIYLNK